MDPPGRNPGYAPADLSLCFAMMLNHNCVPLSMSKVILSPIVNDKTGNISDKDNYKPIALATVSSKILERVILNRCRLNLDTGDHQFGFKERHSTDMAVYAFNPRPAGGGAFERPPPLRFFEDSKKKNGGAQRRRVFTHLIPHFFRNFCKKFDPMPCEVRSPGQVK